MSTSNPQIVPINILDSIQQIPAGAQQAGKTMIDPVGMLGNVVTTITVQGRRAH
jgi:hypothetical protein